MRKIIKVLKGHKDYITMETLFSYFNYHLVFSKEPETDCRLAGIKKPYCLSFFKEKEFLIDTKYIFCFIF